jgi:alpha-beta hydrolase superfamily lysophospholipase
MRVILIHGMGRTPRSMMLLGMRLKHAGFEVSSFGYDVRKTPLHEIADQFAMFVRRHAEHAEPFSVVTHSLGGVITRMASPVLPGLSRIVMLAPPNASPRLASLVQRHASAPYRFLFRDAGQQLLDASFYARLPIPSAKTLVIAGDSGPRVHFAGAPNDAVVAVDETRLEGAEHHVMHTIHTLSMNDREVTRRTIAFLQRA